MIALFKHYPSLGAALPHLSLGDFPTPVHKSELDGNWAELWIKRDDLSGRLYGGNKIRKLEFLLGDATRRGFRSVMTYGCAGSNHALATAIYAGKLGLRPISILLPQPPSRAVQRNLLRSAAAGAEIHYYRNVHFQKPGSRFVSLKERLFHGKRPYIIPPGGSSPLGALGFVNAAWELRDQIEAGVCPEPDLIYVALGTMGTAAGLALGLVSAGLKTRVQAVRVVPESIANRNTFDGLFHQTSRLLKRYEPDFSGIRNKKLPLDIRNAFYGEAYGLYTQEGMDAVRLARKRMDLYLEGTYTGKTFAALLHDAGEGRLKNRRILFWNTVNSVDFSTDIRDVPYSRLPRSLYSYFRDPVQSLDQSPAL
jgi:D-cysteine desulfhydrase